MSGAIEMSNKELTYLVSELKEQVEFLRRKIESSGGSEVPEPLDVQQLYAKDEISVGIDSNGNYNSDSMIRMYSDTFYGADFGRIYAANLSGGMRLTLYFDEVYINSTKIY